MKLTYRGINYQTRTPGTIINNLDKAISLDKKIQDIRQGENKVILVRPIHYYTYRGVSYTKNLFFDYDTKSLIDIDRH